MTEAFLLVDHARNRLQMIQTAQLVNSSFDVGQHSPYIHSKSHGESSSQAEEVADVPCLTLQCCSWPTFTSAQKVYIQDVLLYVE